jgi:hypothetical protein
MVDYEETLGELHGLLGQRVIVQFATAQMLGGMMAGSLRRGASSPITDLRKFGGRSTNPDETLLFEVDSADYIFRIDRERFDSAEWTDEGGFRQLRIKSRDLLTIIAPVTRLGQRPRGT